MQVQGAILAPATAKPGVGSDAVATVVYFHDVVCKAHVNLLMNILIGHRIHHAVYRDMVVVLDCSSSPLGKLKRKSRKRQEIGLFLFYEYLIRRAIPLLKLAVIVGLKLFCNGFIELAEGKELLIAEG